MSCSLLVICAPLTNATSHAEDIVDHVDHFVTHLHESVGWGGFAVFGGPDENGEARIHVYVHIYGRFCMCIDLLRV